MFYILADYLRKSASCLTVLFLAARVCERSPRDDRLIRIEIGTQTQRALRGSLAVAASPDARTIITRDMHHEHRCKLAYRGLAAVYYIRQ